MNWVDYKDGIQALFDQGGLTLWAILFASILLWVLIVERYWFHWLQLPTLHEQLLGEWKDWKTRHKDYRQVRESVLMRRVQGLVGDLTAEASRNLLALQALTVILPLLGLLGTVSGMIKVFEVITVFGTGNTRGMASGISEALVTTMAGLFTALSGIYFVSDLENRTSELSRRFEVGDEIDTR